MSEEKRYDLKGEELESMLKSYKKDDMITDENLNLSDEDMKWWKDAKFGMFIHWGLYSILGKGEWGMFHEGLSKDEYRKLMDEFNPDKFNADEWVDLAQEAGCKYMVLTTRHHDGFSLWDSKGSYESFDSMHAPAKRDFVKAYTDACHRKGMRTGLFYSLMDWRFPGYFEPEKELESALLMKKQLYSQVEELMTSYGDIDILWYDGGWLAHKGTDADAAWLWEPVKLNTMVKKHQPKVVINPRSGLRGDFKTEEGCGDITGKIRGYAWEKCMPAVNGAWGYMPGHVARPYEEILRIMINTFTRGGNLILNMGPLPDGSIPEDHVECFKNIGKWMKENGESVYGTEGGPIQPVDGVFGTTCKDNVIYVHITDYEKFSELIVPIEYEIITKATLLDGSEVTFEKAECGIKITVPEEKRTAIDTIVKLEVTAMPQIQK